MASDFDKDDSWTDDGKRYIHIRMHEDLYNELKAMAYTKGMGKNLNPLIRYLLDQYKEKESVKEEDQ